MADLTIQPIDADFQVVSVAASAGGDTFKSSKVVRLWVFNQHPIDDLTVTVTEQLQCNHPHHGIQNQVITVPAGALEILPPMDPSFMADSDRRVHVGYSHVQFSGNDVVFVAAMRSNQ